MARKDDSNVRTRLAIDPHVHSAASYDGRAPVRRLLAVATDRGLDGLVVTDHDTIDASWRTVDLGPEYGLVALPGVEVSTRDGHLLAVGVEDAPPPDRPFEWTVRWIRNADGVAIVPHPFQRSRHGVPRREINDCDGIKTLNACSMLNVRNGQARQFASEHGYPRFGGSDAHVASEIGRAYTEVTLEGSIDDLSSIPPEAVLDALRRGEAQPCGTVSKRRRSVWKYSRNARMKSTRLAKSAVGVVKVAGSWLGGAVQ